MELLVIGADGADPRLLSYYLAKDTMPNLSAVLSESGVEMKPMASRFSGNDVPHTGPAWTSIYTGLRASQHGVTEEGWIKGKISLSHHYDQTIFHDLMSNGLAVGALTMAITYPAQVTNDESWMVSGYPSTGNEERIIAPTRKQEALPSDYADIQAKSLFEDYTPKPAHQWRSAEKRKVGGVLPELSSGHEDVLFYGTQITDTMGHRANYRPFPLNGGVKLLSEKINNLLGTSIQPPRIGSIAWTDEMQTAYDTLDWVIGELVEEYNPDDVLIVSDHGFKLDGEDHSFLGTSIATDGIDRPESILEVKRVILERFDLEVDSEQRDIDRPEVELDEDDSKDVMEQLDALGYR